MAADIPGVRDVTGDDGAALIAPGDAAALARAVALLAADHAMRERLGSAARTLAAEHTWQRRGRRIIEAVGELRDNRRPPMSGTKSRKGRGRSTRRRR